MAKNLDRVLPILYSNWFAYEDLQPEGMWILEEPDRSAAKVDHFFNSKFPERIYFISKLHLVEKSLSEWHRFHAIHCAQYWFLGSEPRPSLPLLEPRRHVFEIGIGYFSENMETGVLTVDFIFGPRYGRGYELSTDGELQGIWVS
jgi:hypothetical protein